VLVGAAFAVASFLGWWAVPVAAAIYGAMTHRHRVGPLLAGVAGMLAWAALLAFGAWVGPLSNVASLVGGVLQVRPIAVYAATLAFPGLLAVSASLVARTLTRALARLQAYSSIVRSLRRSSSRSP
jgi:hypothetical protein